MAYQQLPCTALDERSSVWMIPIQYAVDPSTRTVTGITVHLISLGLNDLIECVYSDSAQLWAKKATLASEPKTVAEGDLVIINAELTPKPFLQPQPSRMVPTYPVQQAVSHSLPPAAASGFGSPGFGSPFGTGSGFGACATSSSSTSFSYGSAPGHNGCVNWISEAVPPKPEPRTVPNTIKVVMDEMRRFCGVYKVQGVGHPHGDVNKVRLILSPYCIPPGRTLYLSHSGLAPDHAISREDDQFVLQGMRGLDREYMIDSLVDEQQRLRDQVRTLNEKVRALEGRRGEGADRAEGVTVGEIIDGV
jgi:hypothetical protein